MATYTSAHEHLAANSYQIQREVEATGSVVTTVKHRPTNFDHEDNDILGGWSEKPGTCPTCHYMRSANGSCECS